MFRKRQKKWRSRLVVSSLLASLISPISLSQPSAAQTLTICSSLKTGVQIISKSGNCNEKLYEKVMWFQSGNSPKGTPGSKIISMTTCRSKSSGNTQVIRKSCNRVTQTTMKWQRPLGPPDAPSIVSITFIKLGSVEIIVRAPENNGGARVTSYSVVQFNNESAPSKSILESKFLGTSAVSYPLKSREKISVGGLTPGQSYRFAVVASNMAGSSELSESSEEHFVSTLPSQPTITSVSALGPGSALISFAVSESEKTAPITSFTITANPGGLQSTVTSPLLRSHTFIGLSPLTPYTFSITANSDAGSSSPSEPSMSVRTFAPQPPAEPVQTSSAPSTPASSAPASIAVPVIALSSTSETSTTGVALAGYAITSTGGAVASYSISPSAPAGLTFNTSTGLLSGTPTEVASSTIFTITGSNASGSATATFELTVVLGPPIFAISVASESAATGSSIAGYSIASTGGVVASYPISPAAPAGLTFDTSTGLLSGTPTSVSSNTTYTITGTNAAGSATATFDLAVILGEPSFTISSNSESRTANTLATGFTVTPTGGAVASYSISPSAPTGMSFNTSTGAFTGTPTTVAGPTVYTVTATNATGSFTRTFTFTVVVAAPAFTLSSNSENRTVNTAATGFTVSSTGGAVATFSISPSAPAGMSFDTSTGALTGTPTTIAGATVYTVTATNATGSSTATFTLTVVVAAPAITLSSNSESRATGSSLAGYTIVSTGGTVASYSISPSAPAGLTFDTSTGLLSGSPTSVAIATTYTITATNTSGNATATFELTVTLGAPAFTLSATSETRSAGTTLSGYTISSTGGTIASYAISPSAPTGLAFSTSTGLLSGTPTVAASATTYTITATNATGSSTAEFVLTVNVGAASKAMITTQPSGAANGVALTTQPVIRVTDSSGNTVTSSSIEVVASIASGSGTLSGTTTVAAVNGVASFTDLLLSGTAGNFTLTFTPTSLTAATSSSFALSVGAASKAMITTQPSGAVDGSVFTTQPVIRITDAGGNTVTSSTVNVVASIASGTGTLSGTTTVAAVNGVATFTNLKITGSGSHTITFTPADSLSTVTSSDFTVSVVTCATGGSCVLGDRGPGGGYVFYVASTPFTCGPTLNLSCRYLEAAATTGDSPWSSTASAQWYSIRTADCSGTSSEIGTGYKNSIRIAEFCNSAYPTGAANLARAYRGPSNLTDWYLPSFNELKELFNARYNVPGLRLQGGGNNSVYWSSTQKSSDQAWVKVLADGAEGGNFKDFGNPIHAIRSF